MMEPHEAREALEQMTAEIRDLRRRRRSELMAAYDTSRLGERMTGLVNVQATDVKVADYLAGKAPVDSNAKEETA